MTRPPPVGAGRRGLTGSIQYLMIVVPELASLAVVAPVLAELVDGATIHILDLIVVSRPAMVP